jgi:hypothetical protein
MTAEIERQSIDIVPAASDPDINQQAVETRRCEARAHQLMKSGAAVDALVGIKQAVTQWRILVKQDPRFAPDLARSLSRLCMTQSKIGDEGEAIAAAAESVNYWRLAADHDLERHGFALVRALVQLGNRVARLHPSDGFGLREESMQLLLRLLQTNEARYLLPAAEACSSFAKMSVSHRHPQKAREYSERAVEFWRRLAEQDLIKHGPRLVLALKDLSVEQLDGGGWGKAPLREARRVKFARLALRLRLALRTVGWPV